MRQLIPSNKYLKQKVGAEKREGDDGGAAQEDDLEHREQEPGQQKTSAERRNSIKFSRSDKFCLHSSFSPHSTAGADEEQKVEEYVGGGEADHDQGPDDGVLPYGVETSLKSGKLPKVSD